MATIILPAAERFGKALIPLALAGLLAGATTAAPSDPIVISPPAPELSSKEAARRVKIINKAMIAITQHPCHAPQITLNNLRKNHREEVAWRGWVDGLLVALTLAADGLSWSLLIEAEKGDLCLVVAGDDWEAEGVLYAEPWEPGQ